MTPEERLKTIIRQRKEWEEFGWGGLLTVWAIVLTSRTAVELWTGPRADLGLAAWAITLGLQLVLPRLPGAPAGARRWPLQGLWALIAVAAWTTGSWAPSAGGLSAGGGAVLELAVVAAGLVQTGILKSRWVLTLGGGALVAVAVGLAAYPPLWGWRPLLIAATFGVASVTVWLSDRRSGL